MPYSAWQWIIGAPLHELYTSRVRKRAKHDTLDPSHPAHSLSLNCCPLAGATDHWALKQPDTRTEPPPGHIPPEQHITQPSTVNNSSNLRLYIGHIHSSAYGHFSFLYIFILLLLLFKMVLEYSMFHCTVWFNVFIIIHKYFKSTTHIFSNKFMQCNVLWWLIFV